MRRSRRTGGSTGGSFLKGQAQIIGLHMRTQRQRRLEILRTGQKTVNFNPPFNQSSLNIFPKGLLQ